jgi:hypothetical protein
MTENVQAVIQQNNQEDNQNAVQIYEPTFNLPALTQPQEAMIVIHENLDGMGGQKFDKINMPSGGGISFTIVDEDGQEEPVKEIKGVILYKKPFKAWYLKSFDEKTDDDTGVPDCWSENGIHGSGCEEAGIPEGQLCKNCPKNQWGSDRRGGKGKDCADKIRVYILQEENVFPKYVDLPPTSIGNFKDYLRRLSNKLNPFYGVVTTIGLESDKSGGGIKFSKTTFAKAANLSKGERAAIKQYIQTLLPQMERISRESIAPDEVDVVGVGVGANGGGVSEEQPY